MDRTLSSKAPGPHWVPPEMEAPTGAQNTSMLFLKMQDLNLNKEEHQPDANWETFCEINAQCFSHEYPRMKVKEAEGTVPEAMQEAGPGGDRGQ